MDFYGLNKTTLLDYPGHVAATLFTGGCNFRCPFCHNKDLVLCTGRPAYAEEDVLQFLEKRKGILEGICVTGGEPTLQKGLEDFLKKGKKIGLLVKLDTNGHDPALLKQLMSQGLLDYVAMDIKASPKNYEKACGVKTSMERIRESVNLLKESKIEYEFRTTVVKGIHQPEEFEEIGTWLQGAKRYFLQSYRDNENVLEKGYGAFKKEELLQMAKLAGNSGLPVFLRGLE